MKKINLSAEIFLFNPLYPAVLKPMCQVSQANGDQWEREEGKQSSVAH